MRLADQEHDPGCGEPGWSGGWRVEHSWRSGYVLTLVVNAAGADRNVEQGNERSQGEHSILHVGEHHGCEMLGPGRGRTITW